MTPAVKIGIVSITGVGAISAGSAYAFYPSSTAPKITIEKQLEKDDKKLLKSDDHAFWKIKLSTYTTKIKKKEAKINLTEDSAEKLKEFCNNQSTKEFNDQNKGLYEEIKEVCTVPSNREKLRHTKRKLASKGDWATKVASYKTEEINDNFIETIPKKTVTEKKIENWCKRTLKLEFVSEEDKNYTLAHKWCTKD